MVQALFVPFFFKGEDMDIIYIFLKWFTKHKFKKIQMCIQILISIICTLIFIGMTLNINNKLNEIKNLTSISNIKGDFYSNNSTDINKNMDTLIEEMKNQTNKFDFCQFSNQSNIDGQTQLYVDEQLIKNINFSVYKGRTLNNKDFSINYNKECIPILISKKLESKYPLNSEFKYKNTSFTNENNYLTGGATFKVIGILDDNSKFWINDLILVDRLNYFDVIIFPTNFKALEYTTSTYFINIKGDANSYNSFKKSMELKYNNIKFIDPSLKKAFIDKLNDKIIELIFIGMFTLVLLTLSLFGFISIIKSTILLRTKEIGVHYSLGASQTNVICFVLLEILLISSSCLLICYLCIFKLKDYFIINYELILDGNTFLISTIIIIIYILISIIDVAITLLKKEPIELLRN